MLVTYFWILITEGADNSFDAHYLQQQRTDYAWISELGYTSRNRWIPSTEILSFLSWI